MKKPAKCFTGEPRILPSDQKYVIDFVSLDLSFAMADGKDMARAPMTVLKGVRSAYREVVNSHHSDIGYDQKLADLAVSALVGLASRRALRNTPSPTQGKDLKS
jgi:hypothetical protein